MNREFNNDLFSRTFNKHKALLKESLQLEMQVQDPELQQKINEFGALKDKIDEMIAQLKEQETRFSELQNEIVPILEQLEETKEKALITNEYIVSVKRAGYVRETPKYKEAFNLALSKVNGAIKAILNESLDATKSTSTIAPSIGIKKLEENRVNIAKIDKLQNTIDLANSILAKVAGGSINENDSNITPDVIKQMRDWIKECLPWPDLETEEEVDDLSDAEVIKGVKTHFDGGIEGFLITNENKTINENDSNITPDVIEQMRDWIKECLPWPDLETEEEVDDLSDAEVIKGVKTHFDGGIEGFLITNENKTINENDDIEEVYTYHINKNERGGFYADVRDLNGKTVYEIKAGDELEPDETSIFEDGYMKNSKDIKGLESYLKELGIISDTAVIETGVNEYSYNTGRHVVSRSEFQ